MAPNADIRIRILGGMKAAIEVEVVERAMSDLEDEVDDTAKASVRLTLALKWLTKQMHKAHGASFGLRLGMMRLSISLTATSIVAWSLASVVLPALAISLWGVAVAAATLAVAFIGGFAAIGVAAGLMAIGVIGRFKQMSGVVGSAANELQNAGYAVRGAFRDATAAGSDALMRGLARGLVRLTPLLRSLEGSFTAIGQAFGEMFDRLFGDLAGMGPEIRTMFRELVPVIKSTGNMLSALLGYLVQVATIGAPLVADAFDWLAKKMRGWTETFTGGDIDRAKAKLKGFADGVMLFVRAFVKPLKPIFGPAMEDAGKTWQEVAPKLGHLLGVIVAGFIQLGQDVLPVVAGAISFLSRIVGDNGDRIETLLKVVIALTAALKIAGLVIGLGKAFGFLAPSATGAALAVDALAISVGGLTLGALLGSIVAVGAAFYVAYKNVKGFRDAVNDTAATFGVGPTKENSPARRAARSQSQWWHGLSFPDWRNMVGHAGGGTMTRPGWSWVGERGPELVKLPQASTVFPSAESRSIAASDRPQREPEAKTPNVLHATFNSILDGRVISQTVREFDLGTKALAG